MNKKHRGFTIVELLVVIAVITLLATVGIFAISNSRKEARDARRVADLKQLQTAIELYRSQPSTQAYPNIGETLVLGLGSGSSHCGGAECVKLDGSGFENQNGGGSPIFMAQIPADPGLPTAVCDGSNSTTCNYRYTGLAESYTINFFLEHGVGELGAGNKCLTPSGFIDDVCP